MSTQVIEDETIFEVSVQEDSTTTHLMTPLSHQWTRLHEWFGSMKLMHQIAVGIFEDHDESTEDAIIGRVIASTVSLISKLPSSALGNKINEVVLWTIEGYSEAEVDDGQRIVVSGHDFNVQPDGTVWIAGLHDTTLVLTPEQMLREPVSLELFENPFDNQDDCGVVINYRFEEARERHLSIV